MMTDVKYFFDNINYKEFYTPQMRNDKCSEKFAKNIIIMYANYTRDGKNCIVANNFIKISINFIQSFN